MSSSHMMVIRGISELILTLQLLMGLSCSGRGDNLLPQHIIDTNATLSLDLLLGPLLVLLAHVHDGSGTRAVHLGTVQTAEFFLDLIRRAPVLLVFGLVR